MGSRNQNVRNFFALSAELAPDWCDYPQFLSWYCSQIEATPEALLTKLQNCINKLDAKLIKEHRQCFLLDIFAGCWGACLFSKCGGIEQVKNSRREVCDTEKLTGYRDAAVTLQTFLADAALCEASNHSQELGIELVQLEPWLLSDRASEIYQKNKAGDAYEAARGELARLHGEIKRLADFFSKVKRDITRRSLKAGVLGCLRYVPDTFIDPPTDLLHKAWKTGEKEDIAAMHESCWRKLPDHRWPSIESMLAVDMAVRIAAWFVGKLPYFAAGIPSPIVPGDARAFPLIADLVSMFFPESHYGSNNAREAVRTILRPVKAESLYQFFRENSSWEDNGVSWQPWPAEDETGTTLLGLKLALSNKSP